MTNALQLRPMTIDDVDDVAALDGRAFGESGWSRRYFVGEITESRISVFYVLADADGTILGYFGTWHIVDQLQLCTFAVDPALHGLGLGAVLLDCVFRLALRLECDVIQLEVRASNTAARALYRSRGFAVDAVRRNFYSKPVEDGIAMSMTPPATVDSRFSERAASRWPAGIDLHWDDRGGKAREHWPARQPAW